MGDGKSNGQKKVGVYFLHNPNTNETYVGSGYILTRKSYHFKSLENNKHHNSNLQEAYNRDNRFEFNAVELPTKEEALEFEQGMLDYLSNNPGLLNISKDAKSPMKGRSFSEESKQKLSHSLKNSGRIYEPMSDEQKVLLRQVNSGNTYRLGKTFTDEQRQQMSASEKERMKDPNIRKHLSDKLKRIKHTPEQIERKRSFAIEFSKTDEGREKINKMVEASYAHALQHLFDIYNARLRGLHQRIVTKDSFIIDLFLNNGIDVINPILGRWCCINRLYDLRIICDFNKV